MIVKQFSTIQRMQYNDVVKLKSCWPPGAVEAVGVEGRVGKLAGSVSGSRPTPNK